MSDDMDDRVRDLLRRKADDLPPHRGVPGSVVSRARRRIAMNALAVVVAAVVVAGGAFAGVRAIVANPPRGLVGTPTPSSSQPSPTLPAITSCTSSQLQAAASLQGAAGSREGSIDLTNMSSNPCTLEGRPTISLLENNRPITSGLTFVASPPQWQVDATPKPPGWPVVTLTSGEAASIRIRWGNWCPQGRAAPQWQVDVGGGPVDVSGMDAPGAPPCNGPGQPSTIEVGPFEPFSAPASGSGP
jgi:hypothetical protein